MFSQSGEGEPIHPDNVTAVRNFYDVYGRHDTAILQALGPEVEAYHSSCSRGVAAMRDPTRSKVSFPS